MSAKERDDLLRRALGDLRSEVGLIRRRAVGELGRLGDPRALDVLMAAAEHDTEVQVRSEAARAVEAIHARGDQDEPGEATGEWAQRILKKASSDTGDRPPPPPPPPGAFARTKKLKKSELSEPEMDAAPVRSSAAENARALEATRQRSPAAAADARRQLLDESLSGMGIPVEKKRYGFKVTVPLLDGRRQFVRVGYEQSDFEADKVIVIFSPCGKADPKQFRWALELNHGLSYGKLGIVGGPHGEEFVMSATLLEATADPAELRKAILSVAEKADKVEQTFGPEDRY